MVLSESSEWGCGQISVQDIPVLSLHPEQTIMNLAWYRFVFLSHSEVKNCGLPALWSKCEEELYNAVTVRCTHMFGHVV